MKLIGATTSPYVRKVRIVMAENKLDYQFVQENVWADDTHISASNPLGKVPCLVMEGGEAVFDSRVIVEYLDTLSPVGKLIPSQGRERAEVKTWEALADGVMDAGILARLKAEGTASPADVILLVDAARLYKGEVDGLFQPIQSKVLNDAIPANLRSAPAADGGISWFGLSTRARVIVYNKVKVQKADVDTYEELGDPKNKGKLCIRSGSHPYNLSLFGAVTEHLGEQKAEAWLKGVVANLARPPRAVTPTRSRRWPPVNAILA